MVKKEKFDFSGYVTRNDIQCTDGRTIRRDAFKDDNGKVVPLVWMHGHNDPTNILGQVYLENRPDGVYGYGKFNNTDKAEHAKQAVKHRDITAMSIHANSLKQKGGDVLHGKIREVSLVLAGANYGAFIDHPVLEHSDDEQEYDAIIYGDALNDWLQHDEGEFEVEVEDEDKTEEEPEVEEAEKEPEEIEHADAEDKKPENNNEKEKEQMAEANEKTVKDVFDSMTEEQKNVVYFMIGKALEDANKGGGDVEHSDYEGEDMKYNVFENEEQANDLMHMDISNVVSTAKNRSMRLSDAFLEHSIDTTGMDTAVGESTYGFNDPDMLFPEYKAFSNTPEWLSRNMDWVTDVLGSVHHSPFSRIKSVFADITEDEARAKGYIKGNEKKEEVFATLKRTTDPQTIYKKQKMDRDDVIDITDFDVIAWIKAEMRVMLNEEIARAILIGDGRLVDSEDKIKEDRIRPVVKDVPLFNIKAVAKYEANEDKDIEAANKAKSFIRTVIRARKDYKGSGNPTLYTTAGLLTEMLLLEDGLGHPLYKTEAELATKLRVSKIVEVEPMEGYEIDSKEFAGVVVNLKDYNVGADKGGEINMFDDFDIDFNQQKYLIETRISGALIKPFSAITVTFDETQSF